MGFVLGINGPAGAGKDTIGEYLINHHGWTGKHAFARNLKNMVREIFHLSEEDVSSQEGKRRTLITPEIFTKEKFSSVLAWMYRTHQNANTTRSQVKSVADLVGTKLHTPRQIIQFIGTDVCRALIPTYHVDILGKDVSKPGNWVVTDVRFENEADFIVNSLAGKVLKVALLDIPDEDMRKHASENSLESWSGFTKIIINDKQGLDLLYKQIDLFLEENNLCRQNTQ